MADPFGTAAIRARVLAGWAASPARFREDANAEEDLVRGGYRDRVVVELAQNGADAALRAGGPGRLSLRLAGDVLVASNTGAPLDAAAVESLSTLRASAKRADAAGTVGRFGVGFAAVLAVSDDPSIASSTGAVRWSVNGARASVLGLPSLAEELIGRQGQVPSLRLPWPDDASPEPGFDTTVRLPLRDEVARDLTRRLLEEVDDALLISRPALTEVAIDVDGVRRVLGDPSRWLVVRRSGGLDPALLADRPVEERGSLAWSVAWALPLAGQPAPTTLHAPTPTDEPLELPAMLIASFPLDPSRRRVAPGRLTDFLVAAAAGAYAELAVESGDGLAVVPPPAVVGALDSALRTAVVAALAEAPVLCADDGSRLRPADAVAVVGADASLRAVLAEVLSGLVADHPALARLGIRRLELADVVDLMSELRRQPSWWRRLYDALSGSGVGLDALGALPVPLADGRLVRGPRGALLPAWLDDRPDERRDDQPQDPRSDGVAADLSVLGLRLVHPAAVHPLLRRLGAAEATPRSILADPAVRAAVENQDDQGDLGDLDEPARLDDVAAAVLGLVAAAGAEPQELPWLGDLLLRDDQGELAAARDLVLPGSLVDRVAEPDALGRPDPRLLARWPASVLTAVGVLSNFGLLREEDVSVDDSCEHDLPDELDWVDAVLDAVPAGDLPPLLPELVAVRDLDLVRADAWPVALDALARDPALRAAVLRPARVLLGDGRLADAPSYTAWWLGRHALLDGRTVSSLVTPEAVDLFGVYDVVPPGLDTAFLAAIGVQPSLRSLLDAPGGPDDLLARLADVRRVVSADQLSRIYRALAAVDPDLVSPPDRVRVDETTSVEASQAMVVIAPHHLQANWTTPPLVVPLSVAGALAVVLDVATSGELLAEVAVGGIDEGVDRPVPAVVARLLGGATPATWWEHDELMVGDGALDWWVSADSTPHACTIDGLARALAWAAGRWEARLVVAAVLADPARVDELVAEARLEG